MKTNSIAVLENLNIPEINMVYTTATLDPFKYYKWGNVESLQISLNRNTDFANEYYFSFSNSNGLQSFMLPADIQIVWETPKGDIGNYFVKIIDKTAYFSCDTCKNFLTFTCENSQTIALSNIGNNTPIIEYSFDKLTWTLLDSTPVSFGNGTDIYVRGNNPNGLSKSAYIYSKFVLGNSNATECTGNIMALINYTNNELSEIPCSYCFYKLFEGCTGLTKGPDLLCEELTNNCYSYMFNGCTSLNYIKALFLTTPSQTYTNNWVYNVAANGTFVKNANATWDVRGVNGIPTGWTVQTASE